MPDSTTEEAAPEGVSCSGSYTAFQWRDEPPTEEGLYLRAFVPPGWEDPVYVSERVFRSENDECLKCRRGTHHETVEEVDVITSEWFGPIPEAESAV